MKKHLLIVSLLAVALAGCSDPTPVAAPVVPQVVPNPVAAVAPQAVQAAPAPAAAPVIINQAAPSGDGMLTGALLGGAVGYMAGSSNSRPSYDHYDNRRPVVNKTVVNKTVVVKQYAAPAPAPRMALTKPTPSYAPSPSPSRVSLSKPSRSTSSFSSSSRSSSRSFGGFSRRR